MPTISIIIPIYNAEKTIQYCFNSIEQQDFSDYEIIAIDDGSKDNSLEILESLKITFKEKLHVIQQKNSGAAMARNSGLKNSNAPYITFIDSDDYLEPDYLSQLIRNIGDNDICLCGYTKVNEKFEYLYKKKPMNCFWSVFKFSATWGKLYRSEIIKENDIAFESFRIGEDLLFLSNLLAYTNKVKVIPYCGYKYMLNKVSVTNTVLDKKYNLMSSLLLQISNVLSESKFIEDQLIYHFLLKTSVYNIYSQRKIMAVKQMKDEFENNKKIIKENYKLLFFWQKGEEFFVNVICNLFLLFDKCHVSSVFYWALKKI